MSAVSKHVRAAAKAEAHLYVWAAVVSILEGSCDPGRQDATAAKTVQTIIRMCTKEQSRCLKAHDAALAKLITGHGAGVSDE